MREQHVQRMNNNLLILPGNRSKASQEGEGNSARNRATGGRIGPQIGRVVPTEEVLRPYRDGLQRHSAWTLDAVPRSQGEERSRYRMAAHQEEQCCTVPEIPSKAPSF